MLRRLSLARIAGALACSFLTACSVGPTPRLAAEQAAALVASHQEAYDELLAAYLTDLGAAWDAQASAALREALQAQAIEGRVPLAALDAVLARDREVRSAARAKLGQIERLARENGQAAVEARALLRALAGTLSALERRDAEVEGLVRAARDAAAKAAAKPGPMP